MGEEGLTSIILALGIAMTGAFTLTGMDLTFGGFDNCSFGIYFFHLREFQESIL